MTQFAGFSWPRKVIRLVPAQYHGSVPAPLIRLREAHDALRGVAARFGHRQTVNHKHLPWHEFRVDTSYRTHPDPGAKTMFFYMGSDFAPGLRWKWADKVCDVSIDHVGWCSDAFCDDTIRGFVMALPHGRGFLAGWSMGEGMASEVSYEIHETEQRAAYRADQMAERVADEERAASEDEDEDELEEAA